MSCVDVADTVFCTKNSIGFRSWYWMGMRRVMVEEGRWRLKESKLRRLKQEQQFCVQSGVEEKLQLEERRLYAVLVLLFFITNSASSSAIEV